MPQDVLINAMRYFYEQGDFEKAADIAKDAAPYFAPRLSAIAHKSIEDAPPDFSFLIETVDEHGNLITAPPATPVASSTDELPAQ